MSNDLIDGSADLTMIIGAIAFLFVVVWLLTCSEGLGGSDMYD